MKLKFWNRKPVENSVDFENMSVCLPKSGKELTLYQIVNAMDEHEEKMKNTEMHAGHPMAEKSHMVKLHDGSMCNVGELVKKHGELHDSMKKNEELSTETDLEPEDVPLDVEGDLHNDEDDEEAKKKALELAKHEQREIDEEKKMKNASQKSAGHFNKLKNAHLINQEEEFHVDLPEDKVARGKARYG